MSVETGSDMSELDVIPKSVQGEQLKYMSDIAPPPFFFTSSREGGALTHIRSEKVYSFPA